MIEDHTTSEQRPAAGDSFWPEHRGKIAALGFWLLLVGVYSWYAWRHGLGPVEAVQALADLFRSPAGPLIYLAAYALRPLLFFPATVITIAAGSLYGPVRGVFIVILASNLSAMIAYGVGRYFGEGLLEGSGAARQIVERYTRPLRRNSLETVLIMRLIFLPYDLVNYLCGFLRIDWRAFLLATIIGSIPGTIAFVLFGASIDISEGIDRPALDPTTLAASVLLVGVSLALSRYFRRREQKAGRAAAGANHD